jgi:hypothetical protein
MFIRHLEPQVLPAIVKGGVVETRVTHAGGGGVLGGSGGGCEGGGVGGGEGGGREGGGGGANGGAGGWGGDEGGGCGAKQRLSEKESSMPVLSAAEVGSEYTARPLLWEVPVAPSPCAATSSVKSPASALRGSQVPVNGSAVALLGKEALAPSLKQASVMLVARPSLSGKGDDENLSG